MPSATPARIEELSAEEIFGDVGLDWRDSSCGDGFF
jgi:hypothetical protein